MKDVNDMLISPKYYSAVFPLLTERTAHLPLLKSVLSGDLGGRVFVDDRVQPHSALIINRLNWIYFVGAETCVSFRREVMAVLQEEKRKNYIWFGIPDVWQSLISNTIASDVQAYPRLWFHFSDEKYHHDVPVSPLKGSPIDEDAFEKIEAKYHPNGGFWDRRSDFFRKGFGYCVKDGEKIVSMILSASVTETEAEIDIATDPGYRRKGLAELLAKTFIQTCLRKGLMPKWDCYWKNTPSIVLAEKLGFVQAGNYPLVAFRLQ